MLISIICVMTLMQRAIWKGYIAFGLVNIPVCLYSAEKRTKLNFHLLDSRNKARVRYERINDETGEEVPWNKIVKAFEYDKGNYVVLSNEEFKQVAIEAAQTIDITNFVEQKALSYVYFETPYYLIPDKNGEKGYVLLREVLKRTNKIGIAKVIIRNRQHLAALIPCDDALLLNLLRYNNELKSSDEFNFPNKEIPKYKITEQELKLSEQLIKKMTTQWKPDVYEDEYQTALMQLIEEKVRTHKVKTKTKQKIQPASNVIDFISVIKKSLGDKKVKEKTKSKSTLVTKKRYGSK